MTRKCGQYNATLSENQIMLASETLSGNIGERDTIRGNTIENRGYLLVYMCGRTYVILYFDPLVFVFAS